MPLSCHCTEADVPLSGLAVTFVGVGGRACPVIDTLLKVAVLIELLFHAETARPMYTCEPNVPGAKVKLPTWLQVVPSVET